MEEIEGETTSPLCDLSKDISLWNSLEVKQFLQENNLISLLSKFESKEIDGYDLCTLTPDDYKNLLITDSHEINILKKLIHQKLLEESKLIHLLTHLIIIVKITVMHENKKFSFQLDYFPDLTVEKIASLISNALGFKENILLMTNDNDILFPDIKFAEILLINPDKYKILKTHVSKEQQTPGLMNTNINNNISSYSTPITGTSSLMNQPKLKSNFDIKNPLQKEQTDLMGTTNKDYPSYKYDNKDISDNQQKMPSLSSGMNINRGIRTANEENEPNDFMQHPKVQMPPQKFVSERFGEDVSVGNTPTYKPFKNTKMGGIGQHTPPTSQNEIGGKMEFKKFNQFESKPQPQAFGNKYELIDPSNINVKESKEITTNNSNNDLNNPSSTYIFNSGELYSYETLKKTQKGSNIPPMEDQQKQFQFPNANTTASHNLTGGINNFNIPSQKTDSNLFVEPQPTPHKDEYKRFSSEKRAYRTERTNLMPNSGSSSIGGITPSNTNATQEEYQPRQYQKYSQAVGGDEMSTRFPTEKFSRYSSRPGSSNPNAVGNLNKEIKEDGSGTGMSFGNIGNKMSLRANLGNIGTMGDFNFEKKPPMMGVPQQGRSNKFESQAPTMKYKTEMFKMNMQIGNEDDNSAE